MGDATFWGSWKFYHSLLFLPRLVKRINFTHGFQVRRDTKTDYAILLENDALNPNEVGSNIIQLTDSSENNLLAIIYLYLSTHIYIYKKMYKHALLYIYIYNIIHYIIYLYKYINMQEYTCAYIYLRLIKW